MSGAVGHVASRAWNASARAAINVIDRRLGRDLDASMATTTLSPWRRRVNTDFGRRPDTAETLQQPRPQQARARVASALVRQLLRLSRHHLAGATTAIAVMTEAAVSTSKLILSPAFRPSIRLGDATG